MEDRAGAGTRRPSRPPSGPHERGADSGHTTPEVDSAVASKLRSLLSVAETSDPEDAYVRFSALVASSGISLGDLWEQLSDGHGTPDPFAPSDASMSPGETRSMLGVPDNSERKASASSVRDLSSRVRVSLLSSFCRRATSAGTDAVALASCATRIAELAFGREDAWRRYKRARMAWLCGPCAGCGDACGSGLCRYRVFVQRTCEAVDADVGAMIGPLRHCGDAAALIADMYGPVHAELLATVIPAYFRRGTSPRPELFDLAAELCQRSSTLDMALADALVRRASDPIPPASASSLQSSIGRGSNDTATASIPFGPPSRRNSGPLRLGGGKGDGGGGERDSRPEPTVSSWREILRAALDPMSSHLADTIRSAFIGAMAKDTADWDAGRGLVRAVTSTPLAQLGAAEETGPRPAPVLDSLVQSVSQCLSVLHIVRTLGERQTSSAFFQAASEYAAHLGNMAARTPLSASFADAYVCISTAEALSRLSAAILTRTQQDILHLLHVKQQGIGGRIHCFPHLTLAALALPGAPMAALPQPLLPTADAAGMGLGRQIDLCASLISLRAPSTLASARTVGPHQMHFAQLQSLALADAQFARLVECHVSSHVASVHEDCDPSQSWRSTRPSEYAPPRCPQLAMWEMRLLSLRHDAWTSLPSRRAEAMLRAVTLCSVAFLQGKHMAASPSRARVAQFVEDCACAVTAVGRLTWAMGWTLEEWTKDESDARIVRRQRIVLDSNVSPAVDSHARHHPADFHAVCSRLVASALVMGAPLDCATDLAGSVDVSASPAPHGSQDRRRNALRRWFLLLYPWVATPDGALLARLLLIRNSAGFSSRLALSLLLADPGRAAGVLLMVSQLDRRAIAAQDAFRTLFTAEQSTSYNLLTHLAAAELRNDPLLSSRPEQMGNAGPWHFQSTARSVGSESGRRWAELVAWDVQQSPPPAWVAVASRQLAGFTTSCVVAVREALATSCVTPSPVRSEQDVAAAEFRAASDGTSNVDVRRAAADVAAAVLEHMSRTVDTQVPRELLQSLHRAVTRALAGGDRTPEPHAPIASSMETVVVCGVLVRAAAVAFRSVMRDVPKLARITEAAFDHLCRAVLGLGIAPEHRPTAPNASLMANEFRCTLAEMLVGPPPPEARAEGGRHHRPSLTRSETIAEMASGGIASVDRGVMSIDRYLGVLAESDARVCADVDVLARLRALWDVLRNDDVTACAARKAGVDLAAVNDLGMATPGPFWVMPAFGSLASTRDFARTLAPEGRSLAEWSGALEDARVILGDEGTRAALRRRPECVADRCYPPLSTAERKLADAMVASLGTTQAVLSAPDPRLTRSE